MYENGKVFCVLTFWGEFRGTPINKGLSLHVNVPNVPNVPNFLC